MRRTECLCLDTQKLTVDKRTTATNRLSHAYEICECSASGHVDKLHRSRFKITRLSCRGCSHIWSINPSFMLVWLRGFQASVYADAFTFMHKPAATLKPLTAEMSNPGCLTGFSILLGNAGCSHSWGRFCRSCTSACEKDWLTSFSPKVLVLKLA